MAVVSGPRGRVERQRKSKVLALVLDVDAHEIVVVEADGDAALGEHGVHPKIVQERLGHSLINMTMDTYSHVLPNLQREAASRLDAVINGSRTGTR